CAGGPAADDEADAEQEVLIDDGARLARQLNQEGQTPQIIVHERDGRAVDGDFAAGRAHRDAHVAGRQRRRVIDAVADHGDPVTAAFHLAHKLDFVLRETLADDFLAADLARDARGDRLAITRNHRDAPDLVLFQPGQRLARFGARLVLQADP